MGGSSEKELHLLGKVVEKPEEDLSKHRLRLLTPFSTSLSTPLSGWLKNQMVFLYRPDCHIQCTQRKEFTVGHLLLKKPRHFAFYLLSLLGEWHDKSGCLASGKSEGQGQEKM